jgi:glycosyltransferase involved in cell wall biosynthesis
MKILIISDAWLPQINGVVRTLQTTKLYLEKLGHHVEVISPDLFSTIPCPSYPEIRLVVQPARFKVIDFIHTFRPDCIHIATEGPLGWAGRNACHALNLPFTTSFHTKFPEYIHARLGIPTQWSYQFLRWFHRLSKRVMVATQSMQNSLEKQGFEHLVHWSRGVDVELFHPRPKDFLPDLRPISMYVGRVAVEKNIEAFLQAELPGTKYVVGGGPQLEYLRAHYPKVKFVGAKTGEELAGYYAAADVFVFPSRTDTFGLVMLEALASGVPIAAYPVPGPIDILRETQVGCLDENLTQAILQALQLDKNQCRPHALKYSWQACTQQFLNNLYVNYEP